MYMSNRYNLKSFINNDISVLDSTERIVFREILKDVIQGMDAVYTTNLNPSDTNIKNEQEKLLSIIGGL